MITKIYTPRFRGPRLAQPAPGHHQQQDQSRQDTVPDLIAYLYTKLRDNEAMARIMDRALKDRYDPNRESN